MKALLIGFAAVALLGPTEPNGSLFDGTWLIDVTSLSFPAKPDIFLLKNGIYRRGGVDASVKVRADGRFHRIVSDGYVDEVAVAILDGHSIRETDRLGGKITYISTYTVSADGGTMTWRVTDLTKPDGQPNDSETTLKRVGQADPAAHSISGSWQVIKKSASSSKYLTWTLKLDGRTFSSSSPNGWGFSAIIDGPPAPVTGDIGMRSVTMPAKNIIVQTASSNGVAGAVTTMELMPDGKRIKVTSRNVKEGTATTFMLHKQ